MKQRLAQISIVAATLAGAICAHAAVRETFLYKFSSESSSNPAFPQSNLVIDKAGNMYGTTYDGGTHKLGTVFELSPESNGGWTFAVIYNFGTVPNDGAFPYGPLTIDSAGNLYGVTLEGIPNISGVVFELSPDGSGGWTETTPYLSTLSTVPSGPLVIDSSGNLYGTARNQIGGVGSAGLIFKLTPSAGEWTFQDIFDFNSNDTDGFVPFGLVLDSAGNLYGTTLEGGSSAKCKQGCGVVFELTQSAGIWSEQVLLNFDNSNGARPYSLIFDASGNLYGNAALGGPKGYGVIYELSQNGGVWTQTILHAFSGSGGHGDGSYPEMNLLLVNGNIYGTTLYGGNSTSCDDGFGGGCGTTFQLSPSGTIWKENILHSFEPESGDGSIPYGIATDGTHLYGVTQAGGSTSVNAAGTVYELSR